MDQRTFINLISTHSGIIHKILYLYVDDPIDKVDLKQEILVQAWSAIGRYRGDASFSTWLYRVALNTVFTFNNKAKRLHVKGDINLEIEEEVMPEHPKSELLLRAIKMLNNVDKSIITLHLEDYDNGEIAEITGLSKNNVTVKLHRIKKEITKRLTERENG